MHTPGPEQRPEASSLPQQIDALLAALDAQGLQIDIEQRVRLNGLLLKLAAAQRLPDDPAALCRLITPILAGSPAQQVMCETTFKSLFASGQKERPPGPRPVGPDTPDDSPRQSTWSWETGLARKLMAGAMAFLLAAGMYFAITGAFRSHQQDVHKRSDTVIPINPARLDIEWIKNYPIEELEPPRQRPWNRSSRWYYTEYDLTKWIALLLPWIMYVGFLAYLYHRLLAYLRREALKHNLRSLDWRLGGANAQFGDRGLIGELQPLRRLPRTYLRVFDPERTALASAESGGLLQPCFKEHPVPTDFVALIDRQSARDHLAAYNMEVVRSLRNVGISVEVLEFNRDPTLCHFVRMGEFMRLDAVVRRFPDSILLIFASVDQLIDPARNRLLPAVTSVREARRAVLLTPESDDTETPLERALARDLGIAILRTTPAAFGKLVGMLLPSDARGGRTARRRETPPMNVSALVDFFAERPGRWMQTVAPNSADCRRLQEHLRHVLKPPVLRWLTATAVYPELRWPLTLSLKSAVGQSRGKWGALDGELLAVSRLPWFRNGWMPNWTRSLLQQLLAEAEKSRVRQVILNAIGLAGRRAGRIGEDIQINVAEDRVRREDRVRTDNIMLKYLLPALLSSERLFALPNAWARKLIEKPLRRLAGMAAVGVLVATGMSFAFVSLVPINECDLLASSLIDNLRMGPGTDGLPLEKFFRDRALVACRQATEQHPENARFWFQLARAYYMSDSAREFNDFISFALKASKLGYPAAYNSLGYAYDTRPESLGGRDVVLAKKNYEIAVERGNIWSLYNLSVLAHEQKMFVEEFELLNRYKDAGGVFLQDLAMFYTRGDAFGRGQANIVAEDQKEYLRILMLGSDGGGDTDYAIGLLYQYGQGVDKDERIANKYFEMSIRRTATPEPAVLLAQRYLDDANGNEQDFEKATYWAIYAAKFGNSKGIDLLFDLLETKRAKFKAGFGPSDSFDILDLKRRTAEAGSAGQKFELAHDLELRGNLSEALSWYRLAAALGHDGAKDAVKRLGAPDTQ